MRVSRYKILWPLWGSMGITAKTEKILREYALKQIFGKLKRSGSGNHNTKYNGVGHEISGELI